MVIPLSEVLESPLFRRAQPNILAGASAIFRTNVRWVHSSEVLKIAPLLRGEELLLSGGEALLNLRTEAQLEYLHSLVERHVAALAIETAGLQKKISAQLVAAAEEAGLPLIELRHTVPFVEMAEEINRAIVSKQATALQKADAISQQLAQHIASAGPGLSPLAALIAEALDVNAVLIDTGGIALAESRPNPAADILHEVVTDIYLGGVLAARLLLQSPRDSDRDLLPTIGDRLASILALALSQRHRPTTTQIADTALMQGIIAAAGPAEIRELCSTLGIPVSRPVAVVILRSLEWGRLRGPFEQILRRNCPEIRTHLDGDYLYGLVPLAPANPRQDRQAIRDSLRRDMEPLNIRGVLGPVARDMAHASWSLRESRLAETLGSALNDPGNLRDSGDFALERLCTHELTGTGIQRFTRELLGELLEHDAQKGTQMIHTLDAWLTSGCNSTATAATLYLERQTLHKRLTKIFGILGGDPRGTQRMAALHLAVRLAQSSISPERDG